MFDDVERIERMSYAEYKQTVYYFNHPNEYDGDFIAFRDKVIDYSTRLQDAHHPMFLPLKNDEKK